MVNTSLYIIVDSTSFNQDKWFKTKDLHPLYSILEKINICDKKFFNNCKTQVISNIDYNEHIKQIVKTKSTPELFKIIMKKYLDSTEGFEYIMIEVDKKLKQRDYFTLDNYNHHE
jgi:hypothetical protein